MSIKLTMFLAVMLVLSFVPVQAGQQAKSASTLTADQQSEVDAAVQAEMKKQGAIGVAVGVIREGKIAYLKGYGVADREKKTPVSTKTVFNWASNSKPLLALFIMLLFGDGLLDLDDDVRKFVPEYPQQKDQVVKIRQVMCHMSGIPHYGKNIVPAKTVHKNQLDFLDPVVSLDNFSQSALQFRPGEKVLYSTFGYILLSAVAQRAGKEPIQDQLNKRIIKPLGMSSFQLDLPFKDQPDWAIGYVKKGNEIQKAPAVDHFWKHGGGAYKTNIEDFAKWAEALVTRKLHTKKLEDVMWQPQSTDDGNKTTWGLGFTVNSKGDKQRISHTGSQEETKTILVVYPQDNRGLVVMCNCEFANPNQFASAITNALAWK